MIIFNLKTHIVDCETKCFHLNTLLSDLLSDLLSHLILITDFTFCSYLIQFLFPDLIFIKWSHFFLLVIYLLSDFIIFKLVISFFT